VAKKQSGIGASFKITGKKISSFWRSSATYKLALSVTSVVKNKKTKNSFRYPWPF